MTAPRPRPTPPRSPARVLHLPVTRVQAEARARRVESLLAGGWPWLLGIALGLCIWWGLGLVVVRVADGLLPEAVVTAGRAVVEEGR